MSAPAQRSVSAVVAVADACKEYFWEPAKWWLCTDAVMNRLPRWLPLSAAATVAEVEAELELPLPLLENAGRNGGTALRGGTITAV
jgi:hypothetical protein